VLTTDSNEVATNRGSNGLITVQRSITIHLINVRTFQVNAISMEK